LKLGGIVSFCVLLQASSAYSAGPHHALFSQSLSSIYKQDVLSGSTDFLRVDGIPVSSVAFYITLTQGQQPWL
jgi:hypothetical protein